MPKKISHLTYSKIKPYGYIIDSKCAKNQPDGNGWGILLNSRSTGWRIAYLILRKKKISRLESHPDSLETFEPVKGRAVIAIAAQKSPKNSKLFYLDRPIVLKKGVWHGLYAVSKEAHIKIFENNKVKCVYQS
jgi:ureidoglycolate hydrolase